MSTFAQRITMALDDLVGRTLTWISMHEFLTDLHFDGGFVLRFEGSATYARHGRAVRVPQKERTAVFEQLAPALGTAVVRTEFRAHNHVFIAFEGGVSIDVGDIEGEVVGYEQFEVAHPQHGKVIEHDDDIAWFPPLPPLAADCAMRLPAAYREYLCALQNNAIDLTLGARRTITLGDSSPDEVRSRR